MNFQSKIALFVLMFGATVATASDADIPMGKGSTFVLGTTGFSVPATKAGELGTFMEIRNGEMRRISAMSEARPNSCALIFRPSAQENYFKNKPKFHPSFIPTDVTPVPVPGLVEYSFEGAPFIERMVCFSAGGKIPPISWIKPFFDLDTSSAALDRPGSSANAKVENAEGAKKDMEDSSAGVRNAGGKLRRKDAD